MFRQLLFVVALLAGIVGASRSARAETSFAKPGKVEWKDGRWDRFTPAEGALVTLVTVGGIALDARLPDPFTPKLDFEVPLLDPGVRGLLRARTAESQELWAKWSDIGYRTMGLFPIIVDAGVVALGVHRNVDVAAQLFLIDYEAFSLAALSQQMTSRLTSRPRPCAASTPVTPAQRSPPRASPVFIISTSRSGAAALPTRGPASGPCRWRRSPRSRA